MLKIRLQRQGKRNDAFYRIVVTEEAKSNSGMAAVVLGRWYPVKKFKDIDKKAYAAWIAKGAQPSATVKKLIEN